MRDIYRLDSVSLVVDNNILVDLYELDCVDLLFKIADKVIIPKIIFDQECMKEIKTMIQSLPFIAGIISTESGLEAYSLLANESAFKRLSDHDKFAIAIAKENCFYCNSNDGLVRQACERLDVKCAGILGILGRAYIMKIVTKDLLNRYLNLLESDSTSCWIKPSVIEEFRLEIMSLDNKLI